MTEIHTTINTFANAASLLSIFPASDKYEFTSKKVFRLKHRIACTCGRHMVYNGYNCSIRKLFHPYFWAYQDYIVSNLKSREDLLSFLTMVRLKEKRLAWVLRQKEKGVKNKELAPLLGISVRRFQQLCAEFRHTGKVPKLNKKRRPRTQLTAEQEALIRTAVEESKLEGAVTLRLYIQKYHGKTIPRNKLHAFLLREGLSKEDHKKKKQRKCCRYERKHSFSLTHQDWCDSKCIPGKQVGAVEDDASRLILSGGEFDHATGENSIMLMKQAIDFAHDKYSAVIHQANTDRGSQFYTSKHTAKGEKGKSEFEAFLEQENIQHIPSRRNHPQTNGKKERWFRTYNENRLKFKSFNDFITWYNNRIHLGLSRTEGITPNEAVLHKLRPGSLIGLFFRRFD